MTYLYTFLEQQPASLSLEKTPAIFGSIYVQNKSRMDGVEALYMYRMSELPLGGELEFTAGGRYFELKDQFWVDARGGNLTDSYWNTNSHNEIGGPGNRRAMVTSRTGGSAFQPRAASRRASTPSRSSRTASWSPI